MIYGYTRISSKDQNIQRQLDALHEAGIEDKYILIDKQSGKDFYRKQYNLLTGTDKTAPLLRSGDCLVILDLDRLGRNYTEIGQQWLLITETIGADIKVLDMPLLNTNSITDSLEKKFVRDLVFQVLRYVAEKELINTKERQRQGIESAKKAGKKFGRPAATYPDNWEEVYKAWSAGEVNSKNAMQKAGVKSNTFYKLLERWEKENGLERAIVHNKIIRREAVNGKTKEN